MGAIIGFNRKTGGFFCDGENALPPLYTPPADKISTTQGGFYYEFQL